MVTGSDSPEQIDDDARIVDSTVGDAEIGDGCRLYERVSIKNAHLERDVEVNAGTYVENAVVAAGGTVTEDVGPRTPVLGSPPSQQELDLDERLDS